MEANKISILTGISRPSVNKYLKAIRQSIAQHCEKDESYFGAKRKKGKSGRGAFGKTIVVGLLNGKLYTNLFGKMLRRIRRFIPMVGAVTTDSLTLVTKSITEFFTEKMNLYAGNHTLMEWKTSGVWRKQGW